MKYAFPLIAVDVENRQRPNSEGWAENLEIAARLLWFGGKVRARFYEVGKEAGAMFAVWVAKHGNPRVTSFNADGDRVKLEAVGVSNLRWAEDAMAVAMVDMEKAHALQALPNGEPKWPTQEEAARFYKVPVRLAHTSQDDADMLVDIVLAINARNP
jgi:hypothetical protein